MKIIFVLLFITVSLNLNAQDTIYPTGSSELYWVETYDSIITWNSKEYCWRKEVFDNGKLFSVEYLALDKFHPIATYKGFYPNGIPSFLRNYIFDEKFTELFGSKELYYSNGKIKEEGQYYHGMKWGNWYFYDREGELIRSTQYCVPALDTLSDVKFLYEHKEWRNNDTITIDSDSTFFDYFPCLSIGKYGIEIIYESGKQIEVRKYEFGKLVSLTRKKRFMRKLIRNSDKMADIKLCNHTH